MLVGVPSANDDTGRSAVLRGKLAMSTADEPQSAEEAPYFTGLQPAGPTEGMPRARFNEPEGTIAPHGFLTPQDRFGNGERGNPLPFTLPPERRREVGLHRETWQLEI